MAGALLLNGILLITTDMKRIFAIIMALLLFAASAMAQMTNRDFPFPVKPDTLKVLGLGNSFTDDGMEYLPDLLEAAGIKNVVLGRLYIGGCTLERHCREYDKSGNAYIYYKSGSDNKWTTVSKKAKSIDGLRDEDWDIVVIQQASGKSGLYDSYIPWLQRLNTILAEECPGAKVMWQQTWSYSSNSKHGEFPNYQCNTDTMHNCIQRNVDRLKKEGLIGDVIPTGPAIRIMRNSKWCDENEFTRDGYHLSHSAGRYTAACTWFEAIIRPVFGKSVRNNSFVETRKEELDPKCAKACRKAAVKAVTSRP